jgi:YggT family protein
VTTVLAVARDDVANYVNTLVLVYVVLIFIRILMSWMPRVPYSRPLDVVLTFVRDVVDPYLNIFRRFVPMARIGPAALDLSPMIGTFVLLVLGSLVSGLIRGG